MKPTILNSFHLFARVAFLLLLIHSPALRSQTAGNLFSDCLSTVVLNDTLESWNLSWTDYDKDGYEDLFVSGKTNDAPNRLLKNDGNNSFISQTGQGFLTQPAMTATSVWADVENNGFPDVFIVNATGKRSMLYLNNGDGTFSEQPNSGIEIHPQYFHGAAFADFNNDGFLDLLITNFFQTRFHQLYKNKGDGTFEQITTSAVAQLSEKSMAPILSDFDNDGLIDIFIPNGDNRPNSLLRNLGNFQFQQVTTSPVVNTAYNSTGAAWGDFNNDGWMDLAVANASNQPNELYLNNGDGTFSTHTFSGFASDIGHSHSVSWVDINNDGWLDLFITNDQGSNFLYINKKDGTFRKEEQEPIVSSPLKSLGAAWADFTRNGFLDVAISTHHGEKNRLFCNQGNSKNYIAVRLVGTNSNRSAIGGKAHLWSGGLYQKRELAPVSGFGGQNSMWLHFGLDTVSTVDSVIVEWPSGYRQKLTSNIPVNQHFTIIEEDVFSIAGIAFYDQNGNGIRDSVEPLVANVPISISPPNLNLRTGEGGLFRFHTNDETLQLVLGQNTNWVLAEPVVINALDTGFAEVPLLPANAGYDLAVSFAYTAWRRGFSNQTILTVENKGTYPAADATASLVYPLQAWALDATPVFQQEANNTYSWQLGDLAPGEIVSVLVTDSVGLDVQTGDYLWLEAHTEATGTDLNENNNYHSEEIEIVGAIDPNDLLASPKGVGSGAFIPKNQWLTYTIRFENIGTWPATYVFLDCFLSEFLDPESFEPLGSSHPYSYLLSPSGLLEVAYRNINLPDSATAKEESQGFFKFRIRPRNDLSGGELISVFADIVFDFEAPIRTNTIRHTIQFQAGREVKAVFVYPNPATETVWFMLDKEYFQFSEAPAIHRYVVTSFTGKIVFEGKRPEPYRESFSVKDWPNGVYIIHAFGEDGSRYAGKFVKAGTGF